MLRRTLITALLLSLLAASPALAAPEGQVTWAVHVSLAPAWFDPAETAGIITPFMFLYALHDALVKSMPGQPQAPSLAESWTVSPDNLTYEFVLRKGVKFHNGDPVTAEDVKFSYERYRGAGAGPFKARTAGIDVVDPHRVRFRFKQPWPDFMTFYGTPATGAGWIVPKKYVEKVGDDGFKRAPVGAGPYKFVSFNPGIELVLEAFDGYWRKTPSVKRLVFRSILEEETRLVALKRGEVDIAYSIRGRPGRGAAAHAGAHPQAELSARHVLARLPRAVDGPQVALGRSAGAAGRQPCSSTGRPSTRPRPWASPRSPGASSRPRSSSSGNHRPIRTTPPGPSAS